MKRYTLHVFVVTFVVFAFSCLSANAGGPGMPGGNVAETAPEPDVSGDATPARQPSVFDVQQWAVERMVAWSKPGVTLHPPAMESFEEGKARYGLIANAVFQAVVQNKPVFSGSKARVRTAALILAVSMFESAYRKDVDMNLGKEGRGDNGRSWCLMQIQLGSPIWIDSSGKRVNLVQVCTEEVSDSGKIVKNCRYDPPLGAVASTPSRVVFVGDGYEITSDQTRGYSGQDLVSDRELCFSTGLRIMRRSFSACKNLPLSDRLSAYASGNCENGREASRRRMAVAIRWMAQHPSPVNDDQLVRLFSTRSVNVPPAPRESSEKTSESIALLP
jgi:hypothetical protein